MRIPIYVPAICLIAALASSPAAGTQLQGSVRTYYIAADEIDWDYAPFHAELITGEKFHFQDVSDSRGMLDPNATVYRKVVFREYTDETFRTIKPRTEAWRHLGILGPLIRAEVGDSIHVVFKNNATRPYSIHPHGVSYQKNSEGAAYQDGTRGEDRADDAIAPGASYTYTWDVPERAGPAERDAGTILHNGNVLIREDKIVATWIGAVPPKEHGAPATRNASGNPFAAGSYRDRYFSFCSP